MRCSEVYGGFYLFLFYKKFYARPSTRRSWNIENKLRAVPALELMVQSKILEYRDSPGILFFLLAMLFSAQAQMLPSEIQNSLKLALPYLTKRCLKYFLGREQSFEKGFRVLNIFRDRF